VNLPGTGANLAPIGVTGLGLALGGGLFLAMPAHGARGRHAKGAPPRGRHARRRT
jgi:hypothetical protein